jgi:uncharacterized protein (DUF488 family)
VQLFTIGFTRSSAEHFFGRLKEAGVRRILDVRQNNTSQLAGFAKRGDLAWFARTLAAIDYVELPLLAPSAEMREGYRGGETAWPAYAQQYEDLLAQREVQTRLDPGLFDGGCLLCSEATPAHCHRRLAAEYLRRHWGGLRVLHL